MIYILCQISAQLTLLLYYYKKKRGYINGTFELKNSPGISYYGYKNLRDFVGFDDVDNSKTYFRFSSIVGNSPLTSTPDDDASLVQFYNRNSSSFVKMDCFK